MSPRPGGEADKFGNRYEGAWTVRHLLYVLNGDGDSITVEDVGDLAEGVEFTYRRAGAVEVHQLKRQHGTANSWSIRSLQGTGIWEHARGHVEAGREFHFVSTLPASVPQELCSNARRSGSLQAFIDHWLPNKSLREAFTELSSPNILSSPEIAWRVLGGTWMEWHDERDVIQVNAALAGLLLDGASGLLAAVGLGDLVIHNLGVELTAASISDKLQTYGLQRAPSAGRAAAVDQVNAVTTGWSASVERELLNPVIPRQEAAELVNLVSSTQRGLLFLVGGAGHGKSAVLQKAVEDLLTDGLPVLGFRLDRLEPFSSTAELGTRLGLEASPVAALGTVAGERSSVLVIDQLDAVSLASGRMPGNFDVFADLVREATAFPRMRVVLACRKFDVDNDHRIRGLATQPNSATVAVASLSDAQVDGAVNAMGLDPTVLTTHQRAMLRSPLHLVLLATVASEPNALNFQTTGHLFDAYWERKRRDALQRRPGARFGPVVAALAEAISLRQRLSVPTTVLDHDDLAYDAEVLLSEHVLVRDGREVAFFHEAFFDYAFARRWVSRSESLVGFLISGEQELFRRAQVRQIVSHLRDLDAGRFVEEVRALLTSDDVRFHIKEAALAVLGSLPAPTSHEAHMLLDIAADQPPFEARLWSCLRTSGWFSRLDADGHIAEWLRDGEEQQNRTLHLMVGAARTSPDRLAELLHQHREEPAYPAWLRSVVRFAALSQSRPLFKLFLDAIKIGQYVGFEQELWLSVHDLAEERPDWVVEVLVAFLVERPGTLELDDRGKVAALQAHDYTTADLARRAADGAPKEFCDGLLPYLLQVMEATARDHDREAPRPDQFSHRYPEFIEDPDLDDAVFAGMASAMRSLAADDPKGMRPTLELLAADPHESAQWLLYHGLLAGGAAYAEWAAELLLQGRHRLLCGYASNGVWVTRQVIQAISPVISDEAFTRLEAAVRDLRFPWEKLRPGWYAFNLLSGMDERLLSEEGRRRLGELRRALGMEQPPEPESVVGGWVGPPIPADAAQRMSDDNWLQAMAKHAGQREDFSTLTGGAREQSHVLKAQVKEDPARFARLALRLTADINSAYGDAILMGLGEAESIENERLVFEAVRHIASLGHGDNDRWLGWSLRPYLQTAPPDLVELIRDRALTSVDPSEDGRRVWTENWSRRRSADITWSGINTARGSLAESLGDLLVHDVDGRRTSLVIPVMNRLAEDPAVPVRACVAHVIGAAMRYARPEATEAFWHLIAADDALLATDSVLRLITYLGNEEPVAVRPILERMLSSSDAEVRDAGGQLAAFAAMEWGVGDLLQAVLDGEDPAPRKGVAGMCAHRLPRTSNASVAATALANLVEDPNKNVRLAAAKVAGALRGHRLRPFEGVVKALLASQTFSDALPQLLITLERAPDRVDELALLCAQRFVEVFGAHAGDIRTSAAGDARQVGKLIIRGLAQSRTRDHRASLLDVLDELLLLDAYGVEQVIGESER